MPITSRIIPCPEAEGEIKEGLEVLFTNGAKQQLTDLKDFFVQESELELLKLAISLLENIKEDRIKRSAPSA